MNDKNGYKYEDDLENLIPKYASNNDNNISSPSKLSERKIEYSHNMSNLIIPQGEDTFYVYKKTLNIITTLCLMLILTSLLVCSFIEHHIPNITEKINTTTSKFIINLYILVVIWLVIISIILYNSYSIFNFWSD